MFVFNKFLKSLCLGILLGSLPTVGLVALGVKRPAIAPAQVNVYTNGHFKGTAALSEKALKPANLFTDNMVIQQGIKAPVWGTSRPKAKVKIEFAGFSTRVRADNQGKWIARMPVLKASGPFTMKISGEDGEVVLKNVMVGEVWIASGQSNMSFSVERSENSGEVIKDADYPGIRFLTVPLQTSPIPSADILKSEWKVCSPATVASFSAVGYFFARQLHEKQGVAIGIINASLGSSSAEAWSSRNMLEEMPEFRDRILKVNQDPLAWKQRLTAINARELNRREIAINAREGLNLGVQLPAYDDRAWKNVTFPFTMSKIGLPGYWGFLWLRREFHVAPPEIVKPSEIHLPLLADERIYYINGKEVDRNVTGKPGSIVKLPAGTLLAGKNILAIRLRTYFGTAYLGRESGDKATIQFDSKTTTSLEGDWKFNSEIEPVLIANENYFNTPTVLYNGMIAPILPVAIRGVIWYQGETNASSPIHYRKLFPALISEWRNKWRQGDFPFLFVQLASRQKEGIADMQYALVREAQTYALQLPNTAMATAVDLGERFDTHPADKKSVGERLALAAQKIAYRQDVVYSGPVYESMVVRANVIRLSFSQASMGMMSKGAELKGFQIAGSDGIFHAGKATISGKEVLVSSSQVSDPKAVRYCFESWCEGNLYNKEGIAAPPFRTDTWEVLISR